MVELSLMALGSAVLVIAVLGGLYVIRTNWLIQQHKDQIEFLMDLVASQAAERNSNACKHPGLMR